MLVAFFKIGVIKMKIVALTLSLLAIASICFAQDNPTQTGQEYKTSLPPEAETFDWSKISPLDFLNILKNRSKSWVTIWENPPDGWITTNDINKLMKLVDSKEPAAPVVSAVSSYLPFKEKSTVGNEAMFLIEGYRQKRYPPTLCSVYYFKGNPEEFKKWWSEEAGIHKQQKTIGKADVEILFEQRDRIFFNKPLIYTEEPLSLDRDFEITLKGLKVDKNLVVVTMGKGWSIESQHHDLDNIQDILKRNGFKKILFLQGQNDIGPFQILREVEDPYPLYTVIFGVTVDSRGKLLNLRIAKVLEAYSGDKIKMDIPQQYFEDAKKKVEKKGYEPSFEDGKPKEFYTYFYFDPKRPTQVIDDLKIIKETQEQKKYSKEIETIINTLKINEWELDISGFNTIDETKFMTEKDSYEYYELPHPLASDFIIYTVIYDRKSGNFWIEKKGGFAGIYTIYGPGYLDKRGKITRRP
jgi:hypothetical protein